jgi:hypothetical protein
MANRENWLPAAVAVAVLLFLLAVGVYVGAYYRLSEWSEDPFRKNDGDGFRRYRSQWLTRSFMPAAKFESLVTGHLIEAVYWPPDAEIDVEVGY